VTADPQPAVPVEPEPPEPETPIEPEMPLEPDPLDAILAPRPPRPVFVLSVAPALRACARVAAVRAILEWLDGANAEPLNLPGHPIMVELLPQPELEPGEVGRFVLLGRGGWPVNELRVRAAIGRRDGEPAEAWRARLSTIPHELAHVGQWFATYGRQTPWDVAHADVEARRHELPSLAPWRRQDLEGGGAASPEAIGRELVARFLAEHPAMAEPDCPPACPCRAASA
jgi:hypothetical protein